MARRGRFRGRAVGGGVTAFLGIRYAEPPFGARRFAAPVPVDDAGDRSGFGPVAPQSARLPGAPVWRPGDEDVLTLNVWAPSTSDGPRPVLFHVHGGAYTFGSSAQPDYDGAALARAGLVVVTCNYRLGFEGFGHVPGRPDNRGLLDQRAALRWVRDTVAVFGGDPDNITVAGQSAGAASALFLAAREPVRRVIAHSVPNRCYTTGFARRVARWIDPTTPESAVASADALAAAQRTGPLSYDPVLFGPVADALPALPPDVDALLCHTDVEYALFREVGTFRPPADLRAFGRDWGIPDHVVTAYEHFEDAPVRLAGDFVFAEPTARIAEAHGRAFLARFTRPPAWHTVDVPFCFGTLDTAHFLIGGPPGPADRALSRRVLRSWVDFCATGDPGWTGVRHWGDETPARRAPWRGVDLSAPVDHPVDRP
ncbi:carboxylesterase family protein [Actinosynnema sp. NPDC059335]|uniref:carboxylesterase family protein n=1 Tax=Actinosynnema sp. NPDC059335 TaxID=3346804 RepID=UPI00367072AE